MVSHESVNTSIVLEEEYPSVIGLDQFSGFACLLRVSTFVSKFISRLQGLEEYERKAVIYFMKLLQRQAFAAELEFTLDPPGKSLPSLVRALDLFLNRDEMIHSSCRIIRSSHFSYKVKKNKKNLYLRNCSSLCRGQTIVKRLNLFTLILSV